MSQKERILERGVSEVTLLAHSPRHLCALSLLYPEPPNALQQNARILHIILDPSVDDRAPHSGRGAVAVGPSVKSIQPPEETMRSALA